MAQVTQFRQANQTLVSLAQRDLTDFWASLDTQRKPEASIAALLAFFPDLLTTYGSITAVLGADWYDTLRDVPGTPYRATPAPVVPTAAAEGSARWAVGPIFPSQRPTFTTDPATDEPMFAGYVPVAPDPDLALEKLLGATQRLVMKPGRDSIFTNAASDPVRVGVARIPSGPTTCRFCVMLASRGAVYPNERSAQFVVGRGSDRTGIGDNGEILSGGRGQGVKARGNQVLADRYHDNCDCVAITVRSRYDYPEGHDLDALLKLYAADEGINQPSRTP